MSDFRQQFLHFALQQNVLKFGEFTTKATIAVTGASKSAVAMVEKAGGSLTVTSASAAE